MNSLIDQLVSLIWNTLSWLASTIHPIVDTIDTTDEICFKIDAPGGVQTLQPLKIGRREEVLATVGYNVKSYPPPFVKTSQYEVDKDPTLVLIRINYFSVNYADICIRWGLYESALKYVGWPIVPGFDFSGVVEEAGSDTQFKSGDHVFGYSLFGTYSSRVLVPKKQVQKISLQSTRTLQEYAAFPAVAATALHALSLAGGWPSTPLTSCKAALVHSAAGGVGSMLIQMLKLSGYKPIVAVVGSSSKRAACINMGADFVIDKSTANLWEEARKASPQLYAAIFDANGVETLRDSYQHLARCGRLVLYGFHSNLPKNSSYLSPLHWGKLIYGLIALPRFDPMNLVLESKSVAGFNLSFFAEEDTLIAAYMTQLTEWFESGTIRAPDITLFEMKDVRKAHELIQSGQTVGKLVVKATT